VHTLDEHALYFTRHDHLGELAFLLERADSVTMEDLVDRSTGSAAGDLAFVVRALRDVGSRAVCIELTTPDLQDFPIRVVRTLVTRFQPIAFGHDRQRLGGRRLYELPSTLGYGSSLRTEQDLNPCPHPIA